MSCCLARGKLPEDGPAPGQQTWQQTCEADPLYAWISAGEAAQIRELREALDAEDRAQLAAEPEDIRHDLMLCRFLRGHGGTVPDALKALRAHLQFRREFRSTIAAARALLPPQAEDYRAERTLFASELNTKFIQLQLPPWTGTNNGMPVSLLVMRFFDLAAFGSLPEAHLREWFISCLEQRSFTLHNQSIRERRMARVVEARDCMGFSFSQLVASPRIFLRLGRVFKDANSYPELLDRLLFFNLDGLRSARLVKMLMDEKMLQKVLFAERGSWGSWVCLEKGLSPAALPPWAQHVADQEWSKGWSQLQDKRPVALSALSVKAGAACEWRVTSQDAGRPAVRVAAYFLEALGRVPTVAQCCAHEELQAAGPSSSSCGAFRAPAAGVVIVEAALRDGQGSAAVAVALSLAGSGQAFLLPPVRLDGARATLAKPASSGVRLLAGVLLAVLLLAWFLDDARAWQPWVLLGA